MEIAPGCIFDHVKISPDRQIPEHTQETLEISLVLRGSGKFCTGKAVRRFFHRHTGTTFVRYLNDYRINVAKGLIGKHGMPVSEACYASGFNDLSYFCRTFKRLSGYSPSRSGDNSRTTEQGQMPW